MTQIARVLIVGFATAALSSCERGVNIEIVGSPSEPDFLLSTAGLTLWAGPMPGIDNLEVVQASRGGRVWGISRDPSCTPTPRFRFGVIPGGWRQWSTPQRLQDGVTYVLSVSGCGWLGGRTFKVLGGRIVSRDGFGDEPIKEVQAMK